MPRPIGGMSVSTRVPQAGGNYRVTGRTPPSGVPGRAAEQRQIADGTDPRLGTGISTACPAPTSRTATAPLRPVLNGAAVPHRSRAIDETSSAQALKVRSVRTCRCDSTLIVAPRRIRDGLFLIHTSCCACPSALLPVCRLAQIAAAHAHMKDKRVLSPFSERLRCVTSPRGLERVREG